MQRLLNNLVPLITVALYILLGSIYWWLLSQVATFSGFVFLLFFTVVFIGLHSHADMVLDMDYHYEPDTFKNRLKQELDCFIFRYFVRCQWCC